MVLDFGLECFGFEVNMSFMAGMLSNFKELFPNKTIIFSQEMKGGKQKHIYLQSSY